MSHVQPQQYNPMAANGVRIQKGVTDNPPVLTPMVHRPAVLRVPIRPVIRQIPKENGVIVQEQSNMQHQMNSENGEF